MVEYAFIRIVKAMLEPKKCLSNLDLEKKSDPIHNVDLGSHTIFSYRYVIGKNCLNNYIYVLTWILWKTIKLSLPIVQPTQGENL